jgi:hypothetical protein
LPAITTTTRALRSPVTQLVVAGCLLLGGAWLIGLWAVGVVVVVFGLLLAADALLRDGGAHLKRGETTAHENVLERWRQAR